MKKEGSTVQKRSKVHKYSELEGEDIDEDTVNTVLNKTKDKGRERHAFDGVSGEEELTEQQVK